MTEISSPIVSEPNPPVRGTCGKVRPGVDVRLVDENDCEVPWAAVGELIVRTDRPWAMNSGYYKNPEATARAWRNGWFHTGDAFRRDADGNFFFVDRMKDAIRRRGENISSFEVEAEIVAHPGRARGGGGRGAQRARRGRGDGDRRARARPRRSIPPRCSSSCARGWRYFMVPRYVRVLPELPKTPSAKVLKADLRRQGVTPDTWDREQAGIVIRRDKIGS